MAPTTQQRYDFAKSLDQELEAYFKALYPDQFFTVTTKFTQGDPEWYIQTNVMSSGPEQVKMYVERAFDGDTVAHNYFTMSKNIQGGGISPYIQRKFLDFYNQIGVRHIKTMANLEVGGYTWARYGFRPVTAAGVFKNLGLDVPRGLKGEELEAEARRLWANAQDYKSKLLGSSWYGRMDLADPEQRATYEAYIRKQGARSDLYKSVYGDPTPVALKPPPSLRPSLDPIRQELGKARMEQLLSVAERRIKSAFNTIITQLRDELDLGSLADLLAAGRVEDALKTLEQAGSVLAAAANKEFVAAAEVAATFLTNAGVGRVVFDQVNTRAVAAMQANQLELVQAFSGEQRRAAQLAMTDGITRGLNPRDQARAFRNSIGLTEEQTRAVQNYRRLLERAGTGVAGQAEALDRKLRDGRYDGSVRRAIRTVTPLPPDRIETMVERYTQRYIKYRTEVIARTEALRAVHEGTEELFQQSFDAGVVGRSDLVRTWDSSRDKRVRDSHKHLQGMRRDFGETFPGAAGPLRYPGDPLAPASETIQCRCLLTTRVKVAKG